MTYKKNALHHRFFRFLRAIAEQLPWLGILYGGVWYARQHVGDYVRGYFDIGSLSQSVNGLELRLNVIKDGLSFASPLKIGDYLGVLSHLTLTQAKLSTAQKTADLLIGTANGLLTIVVWVAVFYAVLRVIKSYRAQNQNNEIANLVVEKLLPFLQKNN